MKIKLFILSAISTAAFFGLHLAEDTSLAAPAFDGPLLVRAVGGKECIIKATHEEIKGKLEEIKAKIKSASGEKFTTAYHFVAQEPPIVIYANKITFDDKNPDSPPQIEKVILVRDASVLETRSGQAAKDLIDLINRLCKTN
ncbi:MAG: hypothetical protein HQK54_09765 [Oligoflexales bacterium]|nr:hypothetical protein [Oligoflexales bacterium]